MENSQAKKELRSNITITKEHATRFFKMDGYASHDDFLGITVPNIRKVAKNYYNLRFEDILEFLKSKYNEERFFALVILIHKFKFEKELVYDFYLKNIEFVNNWNLVDLSAHKIIGEYLKQTNDRNILLDLCSSQNLWEKRISIVSTYTFIKNNDFEHTFVLAKKLFQNEHDLINKAVGWMLREVSKKDPILFIKFMNENKSDMSRTTFSYATEKIKV